MSLSSHSVSEITYVEICVDSTGSRGIDHIRTGMLNSSGIREIIV